MPPLAFSSQDFPLWAFGLPFLLVAIAMAGQTYFAYKRGYMFCGRTQIVEKKKELRKYRVWFCIQVSFVLILLAISTFPSWL
jgi:hypothetical protein